MQYLSSDCIIPVTGKPRTDSVLVLEDDGRVVGIYPKSGLDVPGAEIRHFGGILCPGFVNTHCHLELSWAKGLIAEGQGLDFFVRELEKYRKTISETSILHAVEEAAVVMEQSGIVATGDISNGNHTLEFKNKSQHYFHTFVEVFGSDPAYANAIFTKALKLKLQFEECQAKGAVSIVAHATYSLSNELFRLVSSDGAGQIESIHHQENRDENLFFKDGSGAIATRRNAFNPGLPPYKGTGKRPMESISDHFGPEQKLLLVHNTVSEQQDISFVQRRFAHVYWCLCPNANLYIENRLPDINLFRENNCKITLGTDSLASNHQLSILEEIKAIQQRFPEIPLPELIGWASLNGAAFLGLDHTLGSFEIGKRPGVVLIENLDVNTLQLRPGTTSRLIIPARI
jgi:cytosine/adenosine deaminase-related metal-dependent hydrolase